MKKYTDEQIAFICDNIKGVPLKKMTEMFNERFGTSYGDSAINSRVYRYTSGNGLVGVINKGQRVSPSTEFKKGCTPWNKGTVGVCGIQENCRATQFKKGNMPYATLPVGSEIIRKDGYKWVKVKAPNVWKQKHVIIWEAAHGSIPEKHCVVFKNQDKTDIRLENLMLITRGQLGVMNRRGWFSKNAQLTVVGANVAQLKIKITEKSKSKCT